MSMERSNADTDKNRSPDDLYKLSKPKYNNNKHNLLVFYKIWKNYN